MKNQIRPFHAAEAAGTSWLVAALIGVFAFAALTVADWTLMQALFAAVVICVALGTVISTSIGRVTPLRAHMPTMPVPTEDGVVLGVDLTALRPRDLNAPSPHRDAPAASMISDGVFKRAVDPDLSQPIRGRIEAAQATRIPAPAPINAADPGVARPVGATANPTPLAQPAPLNGRVISPEAPEPIDPTRAGARISRNEAAMAAGAPLAVAPTATPAAQSYNEPGDGADTVEATAARIAPGAGTDTGRGSDAIDHGREGPSTAQTRTSMEPDADKPVPAGPSGDDAPEAAPEAEEDAPSGAAAPQFGTVPPEDAEKPETLDSPRDGRGDDLKMIRGIGPKLEAMLNGMGFWHFDQIAGWTENEVAWVDYHLEGFKGRVTRDDWVPQARTLAEGGTTEFSERYDEDEDN